MKTMFSKITLAAALALALAFTLSCSSDGNNGSEDTNSSASSSSGGGSSLELEGSSSSNGGSGVSSSGGSLSSGSGSSSSSANGSDFNGSLQVFSEDGTPYTGSGVLKMEFYVQDDKGDEDILIDAGRVRNGIVELELPSVQAIPDKYFSDLTDFLERGCEASPSDAKISDNGGGLLLFNGSGTYIGHLRQEYRDSDYDHLSERLGYFYASKAAIVNCDYEGSNGEEKYRWKMDINAQAGWNKLYIRSYFGDGMSIVEQSTRNILTKELKWTTSYDW